MEKSLFEQMGGTYTQVGDYLLPNLILPEQQGQPIGVWGQRHARYLKQHHKIIYMNLLTSGKLNDYLVDIENQAENMFLQIVKQLAKSENITEELTHSTPQFHGHLPVSLTTGSGHPSNPVLFAFFLSSLGQAVSKDR